MRYKKDHTNTQHLSAQQTGKTRTSSTTQSSRPSPKPDRFTALAVMLARPATGSLGQIFASP